MQSQSRQRFKHKPRRPLRETLVSNSKKMGMLRGRAGIGVSFLGSRNGRWRRVRRGGIDAGGGTD